MAGQAPVVTYRVYGAGPVFGLAVLALITAVGAPAAVAALVSRRDWFYAVWLAGLAFIWYQVLRTAFAVTVEGETCWFRTLARRTAVPARHIRSIRASRMGGNVLIVRWSGGTFLLLQPIDRLHEFLAWLKSVNPAVEVRGI